MLQDNGHLIWIPRQQVYGPGDAGGLSLEGDIKMMSPWQPARQVGLAQGRLDDAAQGFLRHGVIVHQVFYGWVLGHWISKRLALPEPSVSFALRKDCSGIEVKAFQDNAQIGDAREG